MLVLPLYNKYVCIIITTDIVAPPTILRCSSHYIMNMYLLKLQPILLLLPLFNEYVFIIIAINTADPPTK